MQSASSTHAFRRCHVCNETCESDERIKYCTECAKPFAPFYYFDDQVAPIFYDRGLRPPDLPGQWRPIHGLTAYWKPE